MTNPMQRVRPNQEQEPFTKEDFLTSNYQYPDLKPFEEGYLDTGDGHQIFYQVAGNPKGIPVVALHGGPGEGAKAAYGEHFDPNIHKIVIFDQRGAGNSLPYAEVENNTIDNLVRDLSALKEHLHIQEQWGVYGISWGTTLAMHYATTHPDEVDTVILDASCFGDQPSAEWLVDPSREWLEEGTEEQRRMKAGAYDEYVGFIKDAEFLGDDQKARKALNELPLSEAYYHCLRGDFGEEVAIDAATQFMIFDTKLLSPELTDDSPEIKGARVAAEDNLALSRLFYHFYINEYNPDGPEALIEKMAQRWNGKTVMIHGTEDIVTPLSVARKLQSRMTDAGKSPAMYTYKGYGHFKMDAPARIATRQIIEKETRSRFLDKEMSYHDAVTERISALKALGVPVALSEKDMDAIRTENSQNKLATNGKTELTQTFVNAARGDQNKSPEPEALPPPEHTKKLPSNDLFPE